MQLEKLLSEKILNDQDGLVEVLDVVCMALSGVIVNAPSRTDIQIAAKEIYKESFKTVSELKKEMKDRLRALY